MSRRLPPCEFRRLEDGEYRCEAAGGARLGPEGGDLARQICGSCEVPRALGSKRSCLYLVPWTDVGDRRSEAKFACRHFHPLYDEPWRDNERCAGCPYWFPRPHQELISDHAEWVERMKRFYYGGGREEHREEMHALFSDWRPPAASPAGGRLRRLLGRAGRRGR